MILTEEVVGDMEYGVLRIRSAMGKVVTSSSFWLTPQRGSPMFEPSVAVATAGEFL